MTDKEFKRLSRVELIEIIYQLQLDMQQMQKENVELKAALESKQLKISKAGSIAEAVIGLSDIFTIAQAAADQYLGEIQRNNAGMEEQTNALLSEAKAKAVSIIRQADAYAAATRKEADEMKAQAQRILRSAECADDEKI